LELSVPLFDGLSLLTDPSTGAGRYPTARLQKGLLLADGGRSLAEEGVGFGVPILKRGAVTVFPGSVDLAAHRSSGRWEVTAAYEMNLVERLAKPGGGRVKSDTLHAAKNALAALHRRSRLLRGPLTATSATLRRAFGWETAYEETASWATLTVTHAIRGELGTIDITVDMTGLPSDGVTEVVLMNEQGARYFDRYRDSSGADLHGAEIGTWNEVHAEKASFVSDAHAVAFTLGQADGARLNRGRELIGSRLAWSGFGYSLPPVFGRFSYRLSIDRVS
jgi:hypothetical protein